IAIAGACSFVLLLTTLRSTGRPWHTLVSWLALAALSWGAALLASPLRSFLGVASAASSRYVTHATLFWIALVALTSMAIVDAFTERARARWKGGVLACTLLFCVVLAFRLVRVERDAAGLAVVTSAQERCLLDYPASRDISCLRGLHP